MASGAPPAIFWNWRSSFVSGDSISLIARKAARQEKRPHILFDYGLPLRNLYEAPCAEALLIAFSPARGGTLPSSLLEWSRWPESMMLSNGLHWRLAWLRATSCFNSRGFTVRTLATAKVGIEVWVEYDPLCPTTNLLMAPQPVCRRMRYSQVVCWLALVMGQEEVDADFN
jgi:hypothetical protein